MYYLLLNYIILNISICTILRLIKNHCYNHARVQVSAAPVKRFIRGAPLLPLNPLPLSSVKRQNFNDNNAGVSSS